MIRPSDPCTRSGLGHLGADCRDDWDQFRWFASKGSWEAEPTTIGRGTTHRGSSLTGDRGGIMNRLAVATVLALMLTGAAACVSSDTPPDVVVSSIQVVGGDGGTQRVVVGFENPLPSNEVTIANDVASALPADGIQYVIQDASSVTVCESVHSFPPPADGTIDVLIPADWFAVGENSHTGELDEVNNPAKFVVCGPYGGFYQYAVWGPITIDPASIDITIDPDGRQLVIDLGNDEPTP